MLERFVMICGNDLFLEAFKISKDDITELLEMEGNVVVIKC